MKIDPSVQRAIDAGELSLDDVAAAAWAAIERMLRGGFASWARARGDADEAKIRRCSALLDQQLRAGKAEFLRPRSKSVQ